MALRRISALAAPVLACALLAPAPIAAEVRLSSNEAGGTYRVTVKSWWEIPFRTVVRQRYDFSCGSAALATLLTYHYGKPTPEQAAFKQMWDHGDQAAIRKRGFSMLDMKNFLESSGMRAEGYRMTIDQLRRRNQPGIVMLDLKGYKHFVVVKGVRGGRVLVGDPMIGLSDYSDKDFAAAWNGIVLAVVTPEDGAKAKFNLAGDWGPWSTAPLESGALRTAVGSLTSYLPPDYQITSQIIYHMQSGTITR